MVAYVLGITDIDPLQYGLLFERFLNPDRVSPPDIEFDFCEARRGEVLEYVRQKYGERRVAQIITFGKLKAKSVVRDVGRVMGMSYRDADRIAKMIPNELNITLDSAVEKNSELKRAVATEPATRQLFDYAKVLEGLSRNAGVHAAGVVIADRDLSDYIPLCRDVKGNDVISQYPMGPLNDLGLLKMDFLGLKTLTVIEDTLVLIHKREPEFSLRSVSLDDKAAFDLYNRGETIGLFQMESGGMTNLSKQFEVKKLDDIIALIALYRPGPMELIPEYVKAKKGVTPIKYLHPLLEEICADTYGVMIYQEQVMAAASKLAGYSLAQADLLRRAMGKKDKKTMLRERRYRIMRSATDWRRSRTSAKRRCRCRSRNGSGQGNTLRWKIFVEESGRASLIAKCWRAWLNQARLIFLGGSVPSSSPVSTNRSPALQQRSAIARLVRFRSSMTRRTLRRQGSGWSRHGATTKNSPTKRSCSDFMSADIRSTHMSIFSPQKIINRSIR